MFALKAILSLLSALLKRAEVRREEALRIEGKRIGRLEAFVEQAQDAERIVKDIENVRREFRRRIDALPDSLRDDDGHRRD
jgi:hypothetical protein